MIRKSFATNIALSLLGSFIVCPLTFGDVVVHKMSYDVYGITAGGTIGVSDSDFDDTGALISGQAITFTGAGGAAGASIITDGMYVFASAGAGPNESGFAITSVDFEVDTPSSATIFVDGDVFAGLSIFIDESYESFDPSALLLPGRLYNIGISAGPVTNSFANGIVRITAVPEASSCVLLTCAALFGGISLRRVKQQSVNRLA